MVKLFKIFMTFELHSFKYVKISINLNKFWKKYYRKKIMKKEKNNDVKRQKK